MKTGLDSRDKVRRIGYAGRYGTGKRPHEDDTRPTGRVR
jgi:hypothetical protein